jgi:alkylhydroperoxidase family enzyme
MRHDAVIGTLREAAPQLPDELPEAARRYVEKVQLHAYRVVDADVEALRAAGYDEEAIFELTLAAALDAGLTRLTAGRSAL